MSVYTGPITDWDKDPRTAPWWDDDPYETSSPNLVQVERHLRAEIGGGNMGIHLDRNIRNGQARSEHSWGAALDFGTGQAQHDYITGYGGPFGNILTLAEHALLEDYMVAYSAELHIQAIVGIGRSWMCNRTDNGAGGWKPYNSGYTGHLHAVTTFEGFLDATPIADRLATTPPPPIEENDMPPIESSRTLDTRGVTPGVTSGGGMLRKGQRRRIPVAYAQSAFVHLTCVGASRDGYLQVSSDGEFKGNTSIVNFRAGEACHDGAPLLTPEGKVWVRASQDVHLISDTYAQGR